MVTDAATQWSGGKFGAFFYNQVDDKGEIYSLYTLSGVPRSAFARSEEHTSELQSLMRISYAVFCLKTKNNSPRRHPNTHQAHYTHTTRRHVRQHNNNTCK